MFALDGKRIQKCVLDKLLNYVHNIEERMWKYGYALVVATLSTRIFDNISYNMSKTIRNRINLAQKRMHTTYINLKIRKFKKKTFY